jgi:serine/threonine-protein kinase
VKPGNVLLAEDGTVYLADFGLTRSAQEGAPEEKPHLSGTLDYVAPEQIEGEPPDPSADIYALGCVLYHCLAGQPPFAKRTQMELLWAHFNEDPPSLHQHRPELPAAIDPVIATALAKEPVERYPSCRELAKAAADALGVGLPAPRISRRKLLLLAAGGALTVAATTGVPAILLNRGNDIDPAKPTTVITRDALQRIDPETNKLVATIPYGQPGLKSYRPGDLAVGEGAAWVIDRRAETLNRVETSTNAVSDATPLLIPDTGFATNAMIGAGLGGVWVVAGAPSVARIDPSTGLRTDRIPLPGDLRATWLDGIRLGSVWVETNDHSVWRINVETHEVASVARYEGPLGGEEGSSYRLIPQSDLPAGALGWFGGEREIAVFDLATAELVANFPGPFDSPLWLVVDDKSGWNASPLEDTVVQLDASTSQVTRKIPVGKSPRGIAFGEGSIWVANSGDGTVSRIDPSAGKVVKTIEVGGRPASVAVGEGGVWVTTYPV